MSDIAAHLGVSRLTVSAVLNGRQTEVGVGEETARRVHEAAVRLGYHRNHLALAMKTGRNPVIGCLLGDLRSEWTSRTLSGMLRYLHGAGYLSKMEEVSGPEAEEAALTRFVEQRIAGIFCVNFNPQEAFARKLETTAFRYGMPIVCSFSRKDIAGGWVDSDDPLGMRLAVEHLWQLGHRRIAFLGGTEQDQVRTSGFHEAMKDFGGRVPAGFIVHTDWKLPVAEETATALLRRSRSARPTAFVCANDKIAAVVLRACRRIGAGVPQDVSVIGFSDSEVCALTDPELTSIAQPFEEIGRRCGEALIEAIQALRRRPSSHPRPRRELIPTRLVARHSTAPAP